MELQELFKYKDNEIKKLLGTDKKIKVGGLIISKSPHNKDKIYKLLARNEKEGFVQNRNNSLINLKYFDKFNFDIFLELKESYIQSHRQPKDGIVLMKILNKTLLKYYSEDKFELKHGRNYVDLIIYYPEITIKNSLGSTHKMKDIYITYIFRISPSYFYLENMKLFRSNFTMGEYIENYSFSHLNSTCGQNSSSFCFGYTDLENTVNRIKSKIIYSEILPFIFAVEEYLSWESLEGKPWKYIDEIKEFEIETQGFNISNDLIDEIYKYLLTQLTDFYYNFELNNGKSIITLQSKTQNKITKIILSYLRLHHPEIILKYVGNRRGKIKEYNDNKVNTINDDLSNMGIRFKDKKIIPKVKKIKINYKKLNTQYPDNIPEKLQNGIFLKLEKEFINYLYGLKNNLL